VRLSISRLACTLCQLPLAFFRTTPGTVLGGPALWHLIWAEVIGEGG